MSAPAPMSGLTSRTAMTGPAFLQCESGFGEAMFKQKVAIGRTWPSLPNHVRVPLGTCKEMERFWTTLARVINA